MQRPFAAFDVDGTVIRWQLYHALADELAKQGVLDRAKFQAVRNIRLTWKKRASENSFVEYELALIDLVDSSLPAISVAVFETACQSVISQYKDQVYTFTRDLIKDLKSKGYLLFAISASQAEIVGMFADHYGFDDYGGSEYEIRGGYFTGKKTKLLKQDAKPELLRQLAAKHNASWQNSIAVGDSEGDIPMLESVDTPVAFNPSRKLFEHAKNQGWQVVVERKNMVYQMEPKNGSYILAETDG